MIIDCHGHYTTDAGRSTPDFRDAQLAWLADPSGRAAARGPISDDEIRESIENNQLRSCASAAAT